MAEPTTRDEHVARAEELAAQAWEVYKACADEVGQPDWYSTVAEFHEAVAQANEMTAEKVPAITALVALAQLHLRFAEVLGQQPAEAAGSRWTKNGEHWQRVTHGARWSLEFFGESEGGPDGENHGWFLFGPSLVHGYWTCYDLAGAQAMADRTIAAYFANPGSKKAAQ